MMQNYRVTPARRQTQMGWVFAVLDEATMF
jgi:hypothetical protein